MTGGEVGSPTRSGTESDKGLRYPAPCECPGGGAAALGQQQALLAIDDQSLDGGRQGRDVTRRHGDPHALVFDHVGYAVAVCADDGETGPEAVEESRAIGIACLDMIGVC